MSMQRTCSILQNNQECNLYALLINELLRNKVDKNKDFKNHF